MGTREGVAAKIDAETRVKIDEMNKMVQTQQEVVSMTFKSQSKRELIFISYLKKIKHVTYMRYASNKINGNEFCWMNLFLM